MSTNKNELETLNYENNDKYDKNSVEKFDFDDNHNENIIQ